MDVLIAPDVEPVAQQSQELDLQNVSRACVTAYALHEQELAYKRCIEQAEKEAEKALILLIATPILASILVLVLVYFGLQIESNIIRLFVWAVAGVVGILAVAGARSLRRRRQENQDKAQSTPGVLLRIGQLYWPFGLVSLDGERALVLNLPLENQTSPLECVWPEANLPSLSETSPGEVMQVEQAFQRIGDLQDVVKNWRTNPLAWPIFGNDSEQSNALGQQLQMAVASAPVADLPDDTPVLGAGKNLVLLRELEELPCLAYSDQLELIPEWIEYWDDFQKHLSDVVGNFKEALRRAREQRPLHSVQAQGRAESFPASFASVLLADVSSLGEDGPDLTPLLQSIQEERTKLDEGLQKIKRCEIAKRNRELREWNLETRKKRAATVNQAGELDSALQSLKTDVGKQSAAFELGPKVDELSSYVGDLLRAHQAGLALRSSLADEVNDLGSPSDNAEQYKQQLYNILGKATKWVAERDKLVECAQAVQRIVDQVQQQNIECYSINLGIQGKLDGVSEAVRGLLQGIEVFKKMDDAYWQKIQDIKKDYRERVADKIKEVDKIRGQLADFEESLRWVRQRSGALVRQVVTDLDEHLEQLVDIPGVMEIDAALGRQTGEAVDRVASGMQAESDKIVNAIQSLKEYTGQALQIRLTKSLSTRLILIPIWCVMWSEPWKPKDQQGRYILILPSEMEFTYLEKVKPQDRYPALATILQLDDKRSFSLDSGPSDGLAAAVWDNGTLQPVEIQTLKKDIQACVQAGLCPKEYFHVLEQSENELSGDDNVLGHD